VTDVAGNSQALHRGQVGHDMIPLGLPLPAQIELEWHHRVGRSVETGLIGPLRSGGAAHSSACWRSLQLSRPTSAASGRWKASPWPSAAVHIQAVSRVSTARVKQLADGGVGPAAIARQFGVARSSVYRLLGEASWCNPAARRSESWTADRLRAGVGDAPTLRFAVRGSSAGVAGHSVRDRPVATARSRRQRQVYLQPKARGHPPKLHCARRTVM